MLRAFAVVLLAAEAAASLSVVSCGAVGDGTTDNTNAFRACAGRVPKEDAVLLVPAGSFLTGAFNLSGGSTLTVEGTIFGLMDVNGYPVLPALPSYGTGGDNGEPNRYQALVHAVDTANVRINGSGVIDGNGLYWWDLLKKQELKNGRPKLVEINNVTGVEIAGVTLRNSPSWTVHPVYCRDVHIHHITINNPESSSNTDGIDPDSSANVLIEHNNVTCGDDAIAIKSGIDEYGRAVGMPVTNVTVRHNVFYNGHGISIGSEVSGGVSDVLVWNNTLFGLLKVACRIKTSTSRGGYIRNILYKDLVVGDTQLVLGINTNYSSASPYTPLTDIRNIRFENITRVSGTTIAPQPGSFVCWDAPNDCKNITVKDVHLEPVTGGWTCDNAELTATDVSPAGLTC
eukprot:gene8116-12484_t